MDANRFITHSLNDPRVTRILAAALDAVEPGKLVRDYLLNNPLPEHKRVYLLGIGKASEAMTFAAAQSLRMKWSSPSTTLRTKGFALRMKDSALSEVEAPYRAGLVITKRALSTVEGHVSGRTPEQITVIEGGHPIPNERSVKAGETALEFVSRLNEDDLLICLISGGGSALMTAPQAGITLADIQSVTKELLACGASIDEINLLRSKLDRVKGGGLAQATKAKIVSLILSDVLGNPREIIASGPTVVNSKANADAIKKILEKHDLPKKFQVNITNILESNSLPPVQEQACAIQNIVIGDIHTAIQAAMKQAQTEGFDSEIINDNLHGEAREVGTEVAKRLKEEKQKRKHPFCLLAGGETTVTLRPFDMASPLRAALRSGRTSKGGRNQELALAAVDILDGAQDVLLISIATDGDDGPTDAGGAVVNGETCQRGKRLGLSAADYLSRNDAYHFFQPLDDLIMCGYTGTNVNDLILLFGF